MYNFVLWQYRPYLSKKFNFVCILIRYFTKNICTNFDRCRKWQSGTGLRLKCETMLLKYYYCGIIIIHHVCWLVQSWKITDSDWLIWCKSDRQPTSIHDKFYKYYGPPVCHHLSLWCIQKLTGWTWEISAVWITIWWKHILYHSLFYYA